MASKIGMSYRNEAANNRIKAALAEIDAKELVTLPDPPRFTRDKVLAETLQLEWLADALEQVATIEPIAPPTELQPVGPSQRLDSLVVNDPTDQKVVEKMVRRSRRPRA